MQIQSFWPHLPGPYPSSGGVLVLADLLGQQLLLPDIPPHEHGVVMVDRLEYHNGSHLNLAGFMMSSLSILWLPLYLPSSTKGLLELTYLQNF